MQFSDNRRIEAVMRSYVEVGSGRLRFGGSVSDDVEVVQSGSNNNFFNGIPNRIALHLGVR